MWILGKCGFVGQNTWMSLGLKIWTLDLSLSRLASSLSQESTQSIRNSVMSLSRPLQVRDVGE